MTPDRNTPGAACPVEDLAGGVSHRELLADLRFLESLGLIELEVDDGIPRWWPTAKGRTFGEEGDDGEE